MNPRATDSRASPSLATAAMATLRAAEAFEARGDLGEAESRYRELARDGTLRISLRTATELRIARLSPLDLDNRRRLASGFAALGLADLAAREHAEVAAIAAEIGEAETWATRAEVPALDRRTRVLIAGCSPSQIDSVVALARRLALSCEVASTVPSALPSDTALAVVGHGGATDHAVALARRHPDVPLLMLLDGSAEALRTVPAGVTTWSEAEPRLELVATFLLALSAARGRELPAYSASAEIGGIRGLEQAYAELRCRLEDARTEVAGLRTDLAVGQREIERERAENAALARGIADTDTQLELASRREAALNAEVADRERAIENLIQQIADARADIDRRRQAHVADRERVVALEAELAIIREVARAARDRQGATALELERVASEREDLESRLRQSLATLERTRSSLDSVRAEADAAARTQRIHLAESETLRREADARSERDRRVAADTISHLEEQARAMLRAHQELQRTAASELREARDATQALTAELDFARLKAKELAERHAAARTEAARISQELELSAEAHGRTEAETRTRLAREAANTQSLSVELHLTNLAQSRADQRATTAESALARARQMHDATLAELSRALDESRAMSVRLDTAADDLARANAERELLRVREAQQAEERLAVAEALAGRIAEVRAVTHELRASQETRAQLAGALAIHVAAETERRQRRLTRWLATSVRVGSLGSATAVGLVLAFLGFRVLAQRDSSQESASRAAHSPAASNQVDTPPVATVPAANRRPERPTAEAPSARRLSMAEYAVIEQRCARRHERDGYRITAKLRTPDEVAAWLGYQATVRGWDDATLSFETGDQDGAMRAEFDFAHKTYVEILVENFGFSTSFDVNSIAASFRLLHDGDELRGLVSPWLQPSVITGESGGTTEVQAITLRLEFPAPSSVPIDLDFRPSGLAPARFSWKESP